MEEATQTDESRAKSRDFVPVNSCGGLVAAVGLTLAAGAACLVALPISSTAESLPEWLAWTFRLAPIPAVVLLWAVLAEAAYRVRVDESAIHIRRALGGVTSVPWSDVIDLFADCGRPVADVVQSEGSMVQEEGEGLPFEALGPEYTLLTAGGAHVIDDSAEDVEGLLEEVMARVPEGTPARWEEATWIACGSCTEGIAVSIWPAGTGRTARACAACGRATAGVLPEEAEGWVVEVRGGPAVAEDGGVGGEGGGLHGLEARAKDGDDGGHGDDGVVRDAGGSIPERDQV